MSSTFRTWAEIDLDAIRHNLDVVQQTAKTGVLAVVKANAYGHGAPEVAAAIADKVELFGVANIGEAEAVLGLGKDVLLLSPCIESERAQAVAVGCITTVSSAAEAAAFGPGARINFKVDTGMGRIGTWQNDAAAELEKIAALPGTEIFSISSHLPVSDEDEEFTKDQLARFAILVPRFRAIAPHAKLHILNSAGILGFPDHAYDLVRPGLMLYGSAYPDKYQHLLKPALTWKARILMVREVPEGRSISYGRTFITPRPMRLATLPAGYADGFPRQVSNKGAHVLVGGKRCAVLGRVTMDLIVVDVTEVPEAKPGDEAVLIGRQGTEEILARELADQAGTIAWDIFTGLKTRVKKIYLPH